MLKFSVLLIALITATTSSHGAESNQKSESGRTPNKIRLTEVNLLQFAPKLKPEYLGVLNDPELYEKYQINNTRRLAHFMAQIAHESAGFSRIEENMNYSEKRLRIVFRKRVSPQKAKELHKKPQEIANWVYGNRLGNRGQNTNDGWNYRGSGFIQLTGRGNFLTYGNLIHENIAASPEKARTPKIGIKTALEFWKKSKLNALADKNNLC